VPRLVYGNPNNWKQLYVTGFYGDPNVPAGYVLESGSDGAPDAALIQFMGGVNSGGFPAYTGDPTQTAIQPNWPNGIRKDGNTSFP
jgi:hypothetical protein